MASSSDIGANFSQYQGDVNLGGGSFGAAKLDTRPIEDLARYTYLYNKSLFDQRQKDADEKIMQIAKLADIHVNDLRGKDRDELLKELNDAITYAQEYARKIPKTPKEKIEQNLEWQKKTMGLVNNHLSGKARSIKYTAELDKIQNDATLLEATKKERIKQLDEIFDSTKISEQFGNVPDYPLTSLTIPTPLTLTANIIQEGANANVDAKLIFYNYKANGQLAFDMMHGLDVLYPSEKTPEGQTKEARQQRTIQSEAKAFKDSAEILSSVLQSTDASGNLMYYTKDAAGKLIFNEKKFLDDIPPSNTLLLRSYTALKNMDADARAKYNQALQFKLSDKGFGFNLPPNVIADDFKLGFVDFTKPIDPVQLLNAGIFSHFTGDKVEKAVQLTDNALQLQLEEMQQGGANWRANLAAAKTTSVGGGITNPALLFGEHIQRVKDFFSTHTAPDDALVVPYESLGDKTIGALNINDVTLIPKGAANEERKRKAEKKRVIYRPDGGYIIQIKGGENKDWGTVRVGTLEDLKQGFIDVVKSGTTQTEGFQESAEQQFLSIFGTKSGSMIFNNWGKPAQEADKNKKETLADKNKDLQN